MDYFLEGYFGSPIFPEGVDSILYYVPAIEVVASTPFRPILFIF